MRDIFITGGTGYIGTRLIKALQKEGGYRIKAVARKGSEQNLPAGCEVILGNALSAESYQQHILPGSTFVHLVGVAHPSPSKKEQFKKIDLVSIQEAVRAAKSAGVSHFVYVSVSQYPTNIMKEYQMVRTEGERLLEHSGISCSFVRPWYVLGPGHWWPIVLIPFYAIFSLIPAYREKLQQQGLVTIQQMINTLIFATKNKPMGKAEIYQVPDIKNISSMNNDLSPVL